MLGTVQLAGLWAPPKGWFLGVRVADLGQLVEFRPLNRIAAGQSFGVENGEKPLPSRAAADTLPNSPPEGWQ